MFTTAVTFFMPKQGNTIPQWEDRVAVSPGDPAAGCWPRFAMADGASEAYDAIGWASCLVDSFARSDRRPRLDREGMVSWLSVLQQQWLQQAPSRFPSYAAKLKAAEGSYATLLGAELVDLDGARPLWRAVAVGDVVLFHVRDGVLIDHFPRMAPKDFNNTPDLVFSQAKMFGAFSGSLAFADGVLAVGDQLFVATDALAAWLLVQQRRRGDRTWRLMDEVDHPETFYRLISTLRHNDEIGNDDVTLLRLWVLEHEPAGVVVCL